MRLAFFFARRYLVSRSRMGAVGWVSSISALAIGVVTAALVCVMAVYAGYVSMILDGADRMDSDLAIESATGAVYSTDSLRLEAVEAMPFVRSVAPVLISRGMLRLGEQELMAELYGITSRYTQTVPLDSSLLEGAWLPEIYAPGETAIPSVLGIGIASREVGRDSLTLTLPRRRGLINPLAPGTAFLSSGLRAVGVLNPLREDIDTRIYMPLDSLAQLLDYDAGMVSQLAIALVPNVSPAEAKAQIRTALGAGYRVLDREEQQPELTMLIRVERLMIYVIMLFILVLAAFNLASSLVMLTIEKRTDLSTLEAMGATRAQRMGIFAMTGLMISMLGSGLGLLVGLALAYIQKTFGLITVQTGLVPMPFPVAIQWGDILLIILATVVISVLTSMFPSIFLGRKSGNALRGLK